MLLPDWTRSRSHCDRPFVSDRSFVTKHVR